ncbi:hypothetical protein OF83DRAFT_1173449 [Amylostereum chailletii]|nr:hypothetical protein OF83DRAFT_1173449 [Amylostereum chailletii]
MVHMVLSSKSGNAAGRNFPSSGFFALTPLTVHGLVSTHIDSDNKPILASALTVSVRCYESRTTRFAVQSSVLAEYPVTLWQAPSSAKHAPLGEFQAPFRITVPVDSPGYSTTHFQDYRILWRVEAGAFTPPLYAFHPLPTSPHPPRFTLTRIYSSPSSHKLTVLRYGPPHLSPQHSLTPPVSPTSPYSFLSDATSNLRAPVLHYHVSVPHEPIGPSDLLSVPISLRPVDPGVAIRLASLAVERRIEILDVPHSHSTYPPTPISPPPTARTFTPQSSTSSVPSHSYTGSHSPPTNASTFTLQSTVSMASIHSRTNLIGRGDKEREDEPVKIITSIVAGTESGGGRFVRDSHGVWSRTLTLQWPAAKSSTRWALGESIATDMARVSFFVKVKVIVSSPSGTESLDLLEKPIVVASTNSAERQLAMSKYATRPPSGNSTTSATPVSIPGVPPVPSSSMIPSSVPEDSGSPRPVTSPGWAGPKSAPSQVGPSKDPDGDRSRHHRESRSHRKRESVRGDSDKSGEEREHGKRAKREKRPHTSSGRPHTSSGTGRPHTSSGRVSMSGLGGLWRPGTASAAGGSIGGSGSGSGSGGGSAPAQTRTYTPYVQGVPSLPPSHASGAGGGGGEVMSVRLNTITGETTITALPSARGELVRAWEEELARIESISRQSSTHAQHVRVGVGVRVGG